MAACRLSLAHVGVTEPHKPRFINTWVACVISWIQLVHHCLMLYYDPSPWRFNFVPQSFPKNAHLCSVYHTHSHGQSDYLLVSPKPKQGGCSSPISHNRLFYSTDYRSFLSEVNSERRWVLSLAFTTGRHTHSSVVL